VGKTHRTSADARNPGLSHPFVSKTGRLYRTVVKPERTRAAPARSPEAASARSNNDTARVPFTPAGATVEETPIVDDGTEAGPAQSLAEMTAVATAAPDFVTTAAATSAFAHSRKHNDDVRPMTLKFDPKSSIAAVVMRQTTRGLFLEVHARRAPLGVMLDGMYVHDVPADSPLQGVLRAGDELVRVEQQDLRELSTAQASFVVSSAASKLSKRIAVTRERPAEPSEHLTAAQRARLGAGMSDQDLPEPPPVKFRFFRVHESND